MATTGSLRIVPLDPREVLSRPAPPPDLTVRYGAHPDQVVDLRLPAGGQGHPLAVFVHGGFWRAEYDRGHAGPLAVDLAGRGIPVATVEYRRVGQDGGGWPGTFDDLIAAMRVVRALPGVDTVAPTLVGHSAGGHLALWYASRPAAGPGLVVALAPIADLTAAARDRLDRDAVRDLLGGGPAELPDRYARADPVRLDPPQVPVVLLHGTADDTVPISQSRAYVAAVRARGGDATLHELPGTEHFAVIDPLSAAWPHVVTLLSR
jgi:acetyl esterase/lipase